MRNAAKKLSRFYSEFKRNQRLGLEPTRNLSKHYGPIVLKMRSLRELQPEFTRKPCTFYVDILQDLPERLWFRPARLCGIAQRQRAVDGVDDVDGMWSSGNAAVYAPWLLAFSLCSPETRRFARTLTCSSELVSTIASTMSCRFSADICFFFSGANLCALLSQVSSPGYQYFIFDGVEWEMGLVGDMIRISQLHSTGVSLYNLGQ